ncbi:MAG: hypothetical protein QXT73_02385 [Candidatus Methanomethylicaceae archaeon]
MVLIANTPSSYDRRRDGGAVCKKCGGELHIVIVATRQLTLIDGEQDIHELSPAWGAWFCCDCTPPEHYVDSCIDKIYGRIDIEVHRPMLGDVKVRRGGWTIVNLREFTPQPSLAVQLPFMIERLKDPMYRISSLKAERESIKRRDKEERIQAILDMWRAARPTVKLVIQSEEGEIDEREILL